MAARLAPVMPPEYYRESEDQSRRTLEKALDPSWGCPSAVRVAVHWDSPIEGIVAYASEQAIDLIVIATHGRTGLRHALLGSVAERIVREAPCPVLTIRSK